MYNKWVIIRIETKSREFLSKMLITYELLKKNYGVIITNKLLEDIELYPKGIYLVNSLYQDTKMKAKKAKKRGNKIVFLDEEGLVYQSAYMYANQFDQELFDVVEKILCFGKEQYRVITSFFPEIINKTVITGNPRMNLLNQFYQPLMLNEVEKIRKTYGKYILVVSNFVMCNHDDEYVDLDQKKMYLRSILCGMGGSVGTGFDEEFEYILKQWSAMKELIEEIRQKFPDYLIVVRPHPSESVSGWRKFAENLNNVEVIREGPLLSWIKASALILENNCTSAIEAMYLHVPAISYRPFVDERFDQPLPNLLSKNVFTKEEALENIEKIIRNDGNYDFTVYEERAKAYVSFQNNSESVHKIIKSIDEIKMNLDRYSKVDYILHRLNPNRFPYLFRQYTKKVLKKIPLSEEMIDKFPKKIQNSIRYLKKDNSPISKFDGITGKVVKKQLIEISKFYQEENIAVVKEWNGNIVLTKAKNSLGEK